MTAKKVSFHTLGCRLNFSESGTIAAEFQRRGYEIVPFGTPADITFLNTCTVTDKADSTCRNLIRKAHKTSPEGKVIVAGCYAQMESEAIAKMTGVDLVLGTSEKYKVFEYLDEDEQIDIAVEQTNEFWEASTTLADRHTRAFLKIQDGCNYICSYCIIPFARGRSRAMSISRVIAKACELVDNGFKEIVLTGVNIGEYEANTGEKLSDLVEQLLQIEGLERLRLSSVEPNTIDDRLLEVMQSSPKFLDHFHLPLQSGDDQVLQKMRRHYDSNFYRQLVLRLQQKFPNCGIGADVIVGHPGETQEQFENTYRFIQELPITHLHVFPFSKRKGTTAAQSTDFIQHTVKKERAQRLIALGEQKLLEFSRRNLGTVSAVLFEQQDAEGRWEGYTTNFIRVKVLSAKNLKNCIMDVRLSEIENGQVIGQLC
jgi:threonylcarbamoyladenosine tRNA methylthiotransferase MtaB